MAIFNFDPRGPVIPGVLVIGCKIGCFVVVLLFVCTKCVGDDASKREGSTQTRVSMHGASRLPNVGVDCSACLSWGMVVLLVMTGCRLFHILMVLGKKVFFLNTCVRAYMAGCSVKYSEWMV